MLCVQFRPMVGGAERQAEKLAHELIRLGQRVTVLTPWLDRSTPRVEEDAGLVIHRFPWLNLSRLLRFSEKRRGA